METLMIWEALFVGVIILVLLILQIGFNVKTWILVAMVVFLGILHQVLFGQGSIFNNKFITGYWWVYLVLTLIMARLIFWIRNKR